MLAERRSRPIIEAAKTTAANTFLSILNFVVTIYVPGARVAFANQLHEILFHLSLFL